MRNSTAAKSGAAALAGFTGRPARDYPGSVGIGVGFVSARNTTEPGLAAAILFGDIPAFGTLPRSVPGINIDHRNTREFRLVGDKRSQLRERPAMVNNSLLARADEVTEVP